MVFLFLFLFFFCFDSPLNFYPGRRHLKCISKFLITNITLDIYKCGFFVVVVIGVVLVVVVAFVIVYFE